MVASEEVDGGKSVLLAVGNGPEGDGGIRFESGILLLVKKRGGGGWR